VGRSTSRFCSVEMSCTFLFCGLFRCKIDRKIGKFVFLKIKLKIEHAVGGKKPKIRIERKIGHAVGMPLLIYFQFSIEVLKEEGGPTIPVLVQVLVPLSFI
jgi:hypothetical protein